MANIYFELEQRIIDQYSIDPTDPNMYVCIKDLAAKILVLRKLLTTRDSVEQVAHEYASSLYLKILSGFTVTAWTKYIMLNIQGYLSRYRTDTYRKVAVEVSDPVEEEILIKTLYGVERYDETKEYETEDYLRSLPFEIKELVLKYSKYTDYMINRSLYLTVLANFLAFTTYIDLSEDYYEYSLYLTSIIRDSMYEVAKDILPDSRMENLSELLSIDTKMHSYE